MNRRTFLAQLGALGAAGPGSALAQVMPPNAVLRNLTETRRVRRLAASAFSDPARSSFGHVRVGGKIYILGGHQNLYHQYLPDDFTADFLEYDLGTKNWRRLTSYPFPLQGVRICEDAGWIYAFGGFRYEPAFEYDPWRPGEYKWAARSEDKVYRYDPKANRWFYVCDMPRRRSSNVLLKQGRRAYLLAGWDGTLPKRGDRSAYWHQSIDVFDFDRQAFVPYDLTLPAPPRRALAFAEWQGKLLLVCGLGQSPMAPGWPPHFNTITAFDPATGTFNDQLFPPFPEKLFSPGACFTGTRLVVAGGMDDNYGPFPPPPGSEPPNKILDTIRTCAPGGTWTVSTAKLPAKAMFPELIPLAPDRILAIGGHGDKEADYLPLGLWSEISV